MTATKTSFPWLNLLRRSGVIVGLAFTFGLGMCLAAGDAPTAKKKTKNTAAKKATSDKNDKAGAEHAGHDHGASEGEQWTCAMHPQVRQPESGQCPICGMDLVEVDKAPATAPGANPNTPAAEVMARRISLSPRAKTLARIRTVEVRPRIASAGERRLLGRLDYDETRVKTITAWTAGRIDRLLVATTGQKVRRYRAVAYIYSPEIYAAQSDLIQAAKQVERLKDATPLAQTAAKAALRAAKQRLRLLGVPGGTIKVMQRKKSPMRNVAIYTPFGGTVIKRMVDEGNYVRAGTGLYRIADLSRLWVQLDAYESDLPHLKVGQTVDLKLEALPAKKLQGKVTFIDPVVNTKTRTVRVRVEVANNDGLLRPGMFAQASVSGKMLGHTGKARDDITLVIPASAALFTGTRSVVYVEVQGQTRPTYEARVVQLGAKAGNVYPVKSGLEPGDRVVARGAFVLDADLQLQGGSSMMTMQDDVMRRSASPLKDVPASVKKPLKAVVQNYLHVQKALAHDSLVKARAAAKKLDHALTMTSDVMPARLHQVWRPVAAMMGAYARRTVATSELTKARKNFEGLSTEIQIVLRRFGNPLDRALRVATCPMAFDNKGAKWVQTDLKLSNSYFGSTMHSCGEISATIAPGKYLARATTAAKTKTKPSGGHNH